MEPLILSPILALVLICYVTCGRSLHFSDFRVPVYKKEMATTRDAVKTTAIHVS